ncbi:MAG: hypothetical protein ABID63_19090 [Pseudomonadota bacterium]
MGMLKRALLRVFVGKSGREALRAYQETQALQDKDGLGARETALRAQKDRRISDRASAYEAEGLSFDEARARALAETLTESDSTPSEILAALQRADMKLGRDKSKVSADADPQRAKLIADALGAMRSKQADLDALDPEIRMKLTLMAVGAFMGEQKPKS